MENLKNYKKYYCLEGYLFGEVTKNFQRGYLIDEEFFAIVIWKRNASKTKIKDSLITEKVNIKNLTEKIYNAKKPEERLKLLVGIKQIGISFASAILTVCYPNDFTVADYRADNTIKKLGEQKEDWKNIIDNTKEYMSIENKNYHKYFRYLEICKKISDKENIPLRDFDRCLWAYDFYEGKGGLKELARKYQEKELEKPKEKKYKSG